MKGVMFNDPNDIIARENPRHIPSEYVMLGIKRLFCMKTWEGTHKNTRVRNRTGLMSKQGCQRDGMNGFDQALGEENH